MEILLISWLLGAFVFQVASSNETLRVRVTVWPPGSTVYLGDSVMLRCSVESDHSVFTWSYRWLHAAPNPRHLASGDGYSITAVTREDAGSYRCQAKQPESNGTSVVLLSQPAALSVSELPPPSLLTLTPSSRQMFRGERFTVRCSSSSSSSSQTNSSSGWMLRRFPPAGRRGGRNRLPHADRCSPLGGAVVKGQSEACVFTAVSGYGGLYWCEGAEGRSNAVHITVSYGPVVLKTPSSPVFEGDKVVLYCQYWSSNHSKTTFFKNGAEMATSSSSSSSDRVVKVTIENVTRNDEGFYKCVSQDRKMESPESWLSVRPGPGNFTSADGTEDSTNGFWMWMVVSSCGIILLFLLPLTVWLVRRYRYRMFSTRRCWPFSKDDPVELPATKQDVTEVQWDLSWMEMSNLLDKQLYPGT